MSDMQDMPKRILANRAVLECTKNWCMVCPIEYVRADLYDTITAERDAAVARAERAEKALEQAYRAGLSAAELSFLTYGTFSDSPRSYVDYLKAKENQNA